MPHPVVGVESGPEGIAGTEMVTTGRASFVMFMASCVSSLIIDSTSLPTYPTSVNLDASTFMNGAAESFASLRDISVLPTPVGPIIIIFLGITSSLRSSESLCLRHLVLRAIATARFALACPITYLSSSSTICLGARKLLMIISLLSPLNNIYSSSIKISLLVYMHIFAVIFIASSTISRALISVCPASALAAASAYDPPDPIAIIPSSGSIISPVPESIKEELLSATHINASSRLNILSVLQSLASSMAALVRFPWYCSSLPSNLSNSVRASAAPPAKPERIVPLYILLIFFALCFMMVFPTVTWPSPAMATLLLSLTHNTVVLLVILPSSCLLPPR